MRVGVICTGGYAVRVGVICIEKVGVGVICTEGCTVGMLFTGLGEAGEGRGART